MTDENLKKILEALGAKELAEGVFTLEIVHEDGCPRPEGGECTCSVH